MNIEDLKQDSIIGNLDDFQLEKIVPLLTAHHFLKGDQITTKGDTADHFYMLITGKIFLEQRISSDITHTVATIPEGHSFGWASIFKEGKYISEAFSADDCLIYSVKGFDLRELMDTDHSMGYSIMRNILTFLNKRLSIRTEQLLHAIKTHPDFSLLDL
ncbi:MAG: cyclic nucleotide-binding domain-containing protein [Desulfobacterales bacterium]|nr:cyclic nucleotide-binding domain-containing protein [Desulfobacterales bacterium]MCP4158943.1 cyclic nucleotide-binding domain-containing protein [Deltaproteobacteria bacterium]